MKEIRIEEFDASIAQATAPFVMRNVSLCDIREMKKGLAASESAKLGLSDSFKVDTNNICLGLMRRLSALGCSFVNNRFWQHDKGHITTWHFDGDGVQVINICLSGSKLFELASPCAGWVVPFTNVALISPNTEQSVVINKGDVLFFPSFWFHKVTCLQNNTVTYNICTTSKSKPCPRDAANICYHKMLHTKLGLYSHFQSIRCDAMDMLALMPELCAMIALGGALSLTCPKPFRNTGCSVLIGMVVLLLVFERKKPETHGTITANAIPLTFGFVAVTALPSTVSLFLKQRRQ